MKVYEQQLMKNALMEKFLENLQILRRHDLHLSLFGSQREMILFFQSACQDELDLGLGDGTTVEFEAPSAKSKSHSRLTVVNKSLSL